jgi:hypothetical protein
VPKDELLVTFLYHFKYFAVAVKRGLKFNVPLARSSVREHADLTANLTVHGQYVNSIFIQVYIRVCTHFYTVSLIVNIKCILIDITPCFDSLVHT